MPADAPLRHRAEHALYRGVRGLLRTLPHPFARRAGGVLGDLFYLAAGRRRRIAVGNLHDAFPEHGEAACRRLARASFRHLGAAVCDAVSASRFDLVDLCRYLRYEGWEHLEDAREEARRQGRGFFGLTAHLGCWEIAAHVTGAYFGPLHVVGRPLDNPHLDRELAALRARFGNLLIPKRGAARRILRAIGGGEMVGLLIDQRVKPHEGIQVPFFGRPAVASPLLAQLSLRTGAPVVPIFCFPEPGGRYLYAVRPPIEPPPGAAGPAAEAALTRRYLERMEEEIRRRPEQWMWMHDRWKGSA